ncbi:MAG: class I adenylate-forming enzyme family protein [Candidatus Sericytochromatia bacterium]|nr:class I adenylate-forming enzyme family protein [Candidatus Sericytochromatia bacterium]
MGSAAEDRLDPTVFSRRVDSGAARLRQAGVSEGDLVAVWGPNALDWVVAALAIWACGAALLPLPPRWTDHEVASLVANLPLRAVLAPSAYRTRAQALGLNVLDWTLREEAPQSRPTNQVGATARTWSPELAALVATSGSTGRPKLAMLSITGLRATAIATAAQLELAPGSVYGLPLPLHHVGGLGALCRVLVSGASLALGGVPPADVAGWHGQAVSHASLVPTQLGDCLAVWGEAGWPASLRAVMVGGAAPPPDLAARCPQAFATYGLTEAGGTVTLSPASAQPGSSGLPLPGVAIQVRRDDGGLVPPSEVGTLWVRGPGLMMGYWDDPAATAQALQDGWLRTGDVGFLDAAGAVHVLARRQDLIVSGGENVYPAEVEAALARLPEVAESLVLGLPDPRWGQCVVAVVVPRDHLPAPSLESLRTGLEPYLARFKHPRRLLTLPALPRLANGKLDRVAVRAWAEEVRV